MKLTSYWLDTSEPFRSATAGPVQGSYDVAVIGGGLTGCSAALALAKKGARVVLLEAETIGHAASGRNGGMCNNGFAQDYGTLSAELGRPVADRLYRAIDAGVDMVERLVAEEKIDCSFARVGKIKLAAKPEHYDKLARSQELLAATVDLDTARAPVCTHSNSDQLRPNGRNTTDDIVRAMATKGGMVRVCGLPQSLSDATPTLDDLLNHIDHYVKLVGVEHVGIAMDYIESFQEATTVVAPPSVVTWRTRRPDIFGPLSAFGRQSYPIGIESVRNPPNVTQGLFDRGYSDSDVAALLVGSWLRAMRKFCG